MRAVTGLIFTNISITAQLDLFALLPGCFLCSGRSFRLIHDFLYIWFVSFPGFCRSPTLPPSTCLVQQRLDPDRRQVLDRVHQPSAAESPFIAKFLISRSLARRQVSHAGVRAPLCPSHLRPDRDVDD